MTRPIVHVVGAGVSGLSAAVHLAAQDEADIVVHESATLAGGRRRPLFDEAAETSFEGAADFVLSSWSGALALIEAVGAAAQWRDAAPKGIAFADLASGERWTLRPGPLVLGAHHLAPPATPSALQTIGGRRGSLARQPLRVLPTTPPAAARRPSVSGGRWR